MNKSLVSHIFPTFLERIGKYPKSEFATIYYVVMN